MLRSFFVVILGAILLTGRVWAQEDNVATATTALQSVLSNLKESVEKLSLDNDQLAARDNFMKGQLLQLQTQFGQLQRESVTLDNSAAQLQGHDPRRAQEITRLEQENYDLDDGTQKAEGGIKLIQESMEAGYQEDQKLLLRLKALTEAPIPLPAVQSPESEAAVHIQKEKLKLMKMIYDSQQRQEGFHESIMILQKTSPLLPAANAQAHQQLLKEEIKDLEAQIAAFPLEKFSTQGELADQWDDTQLRQLEMELKSLERNYTQLKVLMDQMTKKAQAVKMSVGQQIEGRKLQGNLDDLNHQGQGLRADLDDLRSQMIDLDKRKSRLEAMIQQMQ